MSPGARRAAWPRRKEPVRRSYFPREKHLSFPWLGSVELLVFFSSYCMIMLPTALPLATVFCVPCVCNMTCGACVRLVTEPAPDVRFSCALTSGLCVHKSSWWSHVPSWRLLDDEKIQASMRAAAPSTSGARICLSALLRCVPAWEVARGIQ